MSQINRDIVAITCQRGAWHDGHKPRVLEAFKRVRGGWELMPFCSDCNVNRDYYEDTPPEPEMDTRTKEEQERAWTDFANEMHLDVNQVLSSFHYESPEQQRANHAKALEKYRAAEADRLERWKRFKFSSIDLVCRCGWPGLTIDGDQALEQQLEQAAAVGALVEWDKDGGPKIPHLPIEKLPLRDYRPWEPTSALTVYAPLDTKTRETIKNTARNNGEPVPETFPAVEFLDGWRFCVMCEHGRVRKGQQQKNTHPAGIVWALTRGFISAVADADAARTFDDADFQDVNEYPSEPVSPGGMVNQCACGRKLPDVTVGMVRAAAVLALNGRFAATVEQVQATAITAGYVS